MPVRLFSRAAVWLLPPSIDELVAPNHPARFVGAFVDGLGRSEWQKMQVNVDGEALGAPSYSPRASLCVWLYGFLVGIRSARKLERACCEQLPFLWLTGWQQPDHNTLWRFYKANRKSMRNLLKRTVRTAVRVGLVDLAVQAVDGSKVAGNAARDRTYDQAGLEGLLKRTEEAIRELEAQNGQDNHPSAPRLPAELARAQALRQRVEEALKQVKAQEQAEAKVEAQEQSKTKEETKAQEQAAGNKKARKQAKAGKKNKGERQGKAEEGTEELEGDKTEKTSKQAKGQEKTEAKKGRARINLTDEDAKQMKSRQGIVPGYNAQAMVSPLNTEVTGQAGLLITAAEVVNDQHDHNQLVPMVQAAEEMTERPAGVTLADGGYHSGENLAQCEKLGLKVVMAEAQGRVLEKPYHKDRFRYDPESDSYTCPEGEKLSFAGVKQRTGEEEVRVYRTLPQICRACPAFGKGKCTKDERHGRMLEVGPHEEALRRHRLLMGTEESKAVYRLRKELPEPVFGILKEVQGARRFLLRGLANVRCEWWLLATAFNLRTMWKVWQGWTPEKRQTSFC
ncbi:MAG: IS1182 family transposase [Chloroflexi bacterium]|nr:IS1182 family transposase [Chloroflexota bacterium]